jgi:hypothetical protein
VIDDVQPTGDYAFAKYNKVIFLDKLLRDLGSLSLISRNDMCVQTVIAEFICLR